MATRTYKNNRLEADSLGPKAVPSDAYYGIETERAVENFPISGLRAPTALVEAMARIKRAAARVNSRLGVLDTRRAQAIIHACDETIAGAFASQFPVDVFQMGAGTSFHMNMNEVLANRAEELLGGRRGAYRIVHPNDHVNAGQSTNDVYPTAMRLAALALHRDLLAPALRLFERSLARKAAEFAPILKSGRTHLQDAVPIRLGQEFAAYAAAVRRSSAAVARSVHSLRELGIGGSAVGTGLNTDRRYAPLVVKALAADTGFPLTRATDLRESMQSLAPFAELSASLRNLALELIRIANDLRLLASGPRTGLAEISLPPVAPGSSIMPGKVNPSMPEMLNQVSFQVLGCDLAVAAAVQAGQLELNVMMPVVAFNLLFMMTILGNALRETALRAVDGITADPVRCRSFAEASLGLATALTPLIGYSAAAELARESLRSGRPLADVVRQKRLLDARTLASVLDPDCLTEPGLPRIALMKRPLPAKKTSTRRPSPRRR